MARRRETDFSDNVMSMSTTIRGLSIGEMNAVYAMLTDRHGQIQVDAAGDFRIGQLVEFTGKRGLVIKGSINRINRKTIGLTNCTDGINWRVSPSILRVV